MDTKELFATITAKTAAAGKQQAEITQKLEANKRDKAQAEANKRTALERKDEAAYKKACRDLADADAGIEFNTICLQEAQRKPNATEKENDEITRTLRKAAQDIYVPAMLKIEKAMMEIMEVSESAVRDFNKIDEMARTWKRSVMNDHNERSLVNNVSQEWAIQISPFIGVVKPHLYQFKQIHEKNPLFKEGGKR